MALSIIDDIKREFWQGNMVIRLLLINVAIFITGGLISLFFYLFNISFFNFDYFVMNWFWVPASLPDLLIRPWSLFSYMFLHANLGHIFFNMLVLFWFGKILVDLLPNKKVLPIYLLGGLGGALIYIICYNILPVFSADNAKLVGASASVMAIVFAAASINPKGKIRLLFLGSVQLQYLALGIILIDLLSIQKGNAGGHIAHIGGAFVGWLYIQQLRRGRDLGEFFSAPFQRLFRRKEAKVIPIKKRRKEPSMATKGASRSTDMHRQSNYFGADYSRKFLDKYRHLTHQECLNAILDKIHHSGYNSLSNDEKTFLQKASKKDL